MTDDPSTSVETSRRAVLGGLGATIGGFGLREERFGNTDHPTGDGMVVRQGDRCLPVTPLSGEQDVERFYDYYIPGGFASEENGGTGSGNGPPYSSLGTTDLQKPNGSILFLYDGPKGLSLVVVHGSTDDSSSGGSVTFAFDGLPASGSWEVKDDLYRDPDGTIAGNNYDNWNIGGTEQVIDWTWAGGRTDGGAFRGLGGDVSVTIEPKFNEAAQLYDLYYDGTLDSWEVLVPDGNGVSRTQLDMTQPITIETGSCGDNSKTPSMSPIEDIEFNGCGEAWVVFGESFEGATTVGVTTPAGSQEVTITGSALERVPGQYGSLPLFRLRGHGKILAVTVGSETVANPNNCASRGKDENDDRDDSDGKTDDTEDEKEEREREYEAESEDEKEERERGGSPWRNDDREDGGPPGNAGAPGRGPPSGRDDD